MTAKGGAVTPNRLWYAPPTESNAKLPSLSRIRLTEVPAIAARSRNQTRSGRYQQSFLSPSPRAAIATSSLQAVVSPGSSLATVQGPTG